MGEAPKAGDDFETPRERNRDRWLTHNQTVLKDLERAHIELHNWQEDAVPPKMVDHLLVLDRRKILLPPYDALKELAFAARKEYVEKLPTRIFASYIGQSRESSLAPATLKDDLIKLGDAAAQALESSANKSSSQASKQDLENWMVAEAYLEEKPDLSSVTRTWLDTQWREAKDAITRLCDSLERAASHQTRESFRVRPV